MSGIDLSMDPRNWRPYGPYAPKVWARAKPLQAVLDVHPAMTPHATRMASASGVPVSAMRYLPLQARKSIWVAVLAEPWARIVGYLPVDGFLQ